MNAEATAGPVPLKVSKTTVEDCSTYGVGGYHLVDGIAGSFEDTVFRRNVARVGPAVAIGDVAVYAEFHRCTFVDNVAHSYGGAVAITSQTNDVRVVLMGSVFSRNVVLPAPITDTKEFSLSLQTDNYPNDPAEAAAQSRTQWRRLLIWQLVRPPSANHVALCRTLIILQGLYSHAAVVVGPLVLQDDGPIHGADFESCEAAREKSALEVQRGLQPSWPQDASCANETYTAHKLYSITLQLSMGLHTLRTGLITKGAWLMEQENWGKHAYIKIDGLTDPIRPAVVDDRPTLRKPGCYPFADVQVTAGNIPMLCEQNEALWDPDNHTFLVSSTYGGALALAGGFKISIQDSVFTDNMAPKASAISAEVTRLEITNSTMTGDHDREAEVLLLTSNAAVSQCAQNPCGLGRRCEYTDHSTFCSSCTVENEFGDGLQCQACPPGRGPTLDRANCTLCPAGKKSDIGFCTDCGTGMMSMHDRTGCKTCPPRQRQTSSGDSCVCSEGNVNVSNSVGNRKARPSCHRSDYNEYEATLDTTTALDCEPCAGDELDDCIETCQGHTLRIKQGWNSLRDIRTGQLAVFKCTFDGDDASLNGSCPGGLVGGDVDKDSTPCTEGFEGKLCGLCSVGWAMSTNGGCVDCRGDSAFWQNVLVIVLFIVLIFLAFWLTTAASSNLLAANSIRDFVKFADDLNISAIAKIVIATIQISGNLSACLRVTLPPVFEQFLKWLASIVSFDLAQYLSCMTSGAYVHSLLVNIVLVLFVVAVVVGVFMFQMYTSSPDDYAVMTDEHIAHLRAVFNKFDVDGSGIELDEIRAVVEEVDPSYGDDDVQALFKKADRDGSGVIDFDEFHAAALAKGAEDSSGEKRLDLRELIWKKQRMDLITEASSRLLLFVFLLYPGMTSKIFQAFWCRELVNGESLLIADYRVQCTVDGSFVGDYTLLFLFCNVLVVLWPIGLPAILFYLMQRQKEDILAGDEDTCRKFDFVIGDYKPEYWYWEVIEYGRKLVLSGLIGVIAMVGAGPITQSVVAVFIAFFFFAMSVKEQPFKDWKLNVIKSWSEFQIFGVLVTVVVLQAWSTPPEEDDKQITGWWQLILTMTILPVALVMLALTLREMRSKEKPLNETANPLDKESDLGRHDIGGTVAVGAVAAMGIAVLGGSEVGLAQQMN
eukprot:SAG22_NODE_353_length_11812_cov_58.910783_4_plen_1161_part_00